MCAVGSRHPKAPSSAPTLRWVLSTQHTGNPLEESDDSVTRGTAFLIGVGQAQRCFNFERPRGYGRGRIDERHLSTRHTVASAASTRVVERSETAAGGLHQHRRRTVGLVSDSHVCTATVHCEPSKLGHNGAARFSGFAPHGASRGSTSATKKRTVADGANERGRRQSFDTTGWSRPILVRSLELPARLLRAENPLQPTPPHSVDAHLRSASKPAGIVMGALVRAPKPFPAAEAIGNIAHACWIASRTRNIVCRQRAPKRDFSEPSRLAEIGRAHV